MLIQVKRVYSADATREMYEQSLVPLLLRLLQGINVNVLALGGQQSGAQARLRFAYRCRFFAVRVVCVFCCVLCAFELLANGQCRQ